MTTVAIQSGSLSGIGISGDGKSLTYNGVGPIGGANLILRATGSGGQTANSNQFTVSIVAPPVIVDSWVRLDNGTDGAASAQGWNWSALLNNRNLIFNPCAGNRIFNLATNLWSTISGNATPGSIEENFGMGVDETTDLMLKGAGGPGSVAAEHTVSLNAGNTFATWTATGQGLSADAFIGWYGGFWYGFGGFGLTNMRRKVNPTDAWVNLSPSGPFAMTSGASVITRNRAGIDSRTGDVWYVGDGEELFIYHRTTNRWVSIPTTGTKPPRYTTFTLDESMNSIVGFCGRDEAVGGEGASGGGTGVSLRSTHVLDLATLVWRAGPSGASCPPAVVFVLYPGMHYDRTARRSLLLVQGGGDSTTQVWDFRVGNNDPVI
jgi:hypothetical protein